MTIHSETIENYRIDISYDDFVENPFDHCDWPETFGIDLSGHRDYDNQVQGCPVDVVSLLTEHDTTEATEFRKDYYFLPVYCYQHGQIAFSTASFVGRAHHATWDSGVVGLVFISKKVFEEEFKTTADVNLQEEAHKWLSGRVELLSNWANGDVYRSDIYEVSTCDHCGTEQEEHIDCCGGYFGDYEEDCLPDARSQVKYFDD